MIDLNRFRVTKDLKKGVTIFELYNDDRWVPLTKETGEFFASKTLRDRFGGVITMKIFLGIDRTPPALERSLSAASKLKSELTTVLEMESIPLEEPLSLVEDIHAKTQEGSILIYRHRYTDLDMREFTGCIQGELFNNTPKLTETNKRIQRDTKKFEEVENHPNYTDEQRQLYRDRLDDLTTEKHAR